ncbi:hypothetical protein MMC11_008223 [Xylographa trunciseda]|nr:hypothetical protein [Xylographa trunciseda]
MPTKDAMAALVPIVLYPAEQPRTVDIVSQLATADEFANREVAILQAENDEKGNFTASETKGTSVKREYEESCFPDTPISIARGVVAQSQARSARRTPLQKESSAPSMESETFDNEVDRSFSDAQRWFLDLEDQYLKLRRIFEPSDRGWTTIRISLEEVRKEVSNSATSKRVQSRLELMLYEIMVLVTEYYARTHNYRRLRQYRDRLDQYSLLSDARKYILLRDVREYMTQALVDHCKQGYHSLKYCILQYRCLREQRLGVEWRWKESPWSIIADHRYRHAFPNELILPARDSYQLFLFVYHCPADMCLHRAAMHVGTVNRGLAEIKHQLFTDIRGLWTTCWVKQGYTMNDNSLRFIHLMDRKVMKPGFLLSGLRDYEEICVRRSRYDPLAVLKENSAIMPAMGPMSKEMDHLRLQHESSTPSYTSLSSSNCARDEESASDLAFEQSLTTNTSLGISIHGHDKRAKTVTDTRGPVILVPPPPLRLSPSPNHASSGSSGRIVMGNKVVRTSPDKTKVASHADDQCKLQSFHTPLSYQIPEAKLKEAMLASRSTGPAYWQYSLYENSVGERVKVHYCKSKQTTESIAKWFLDKEVIGFDIEWKPNAQYSDGIRKNVSLIQLASEERIALFHIAKFSQGDTLSDLLAPTLKAIMEDPKISKVGVSVKSDCTRLRRSLGIEARGLFELSHLYKLVKYSANEAKKIDKKLVALAKQVEEHLQLPLWKGDVRSSDWSQPLNYQQIQYAASDSYAGLQLYDVMEGKRKALEPTPPRPEHAELDLPIRLATGEKINTAEEPDPSIETASTADTPLPGIEEMARDFLQISIEDKDENKLSKKQYSGRPFEIIKAETWIRKWRSELPQPKGSKAGLASLRAYSLWHHQALEVLDAASLLRNPPLQNSTVASYILEAIRIENLPYESTRLSGLFKHLPEGGKMRYKALRDRINLSIDLGRG